MIWYFLMGMIAGAVGWDLLARWLYKKMKQQEAIKELGGKKDD